MIELTLSMLKPHLTNNPRALENIKQIILDHKFKFVLQKRIILSQESAQSFYWEHRNKFFFNRLISFICSGPIEAYILANEDAIVKWRQLMGPTRVYKAIYSDPCSIRGMYGISDTRNATHGSDSKESAYREINILFPEFSIQNWESVHSK